MKTRLTSFQTARAFLAVALAATAPAPSTFGDTRTEHGEEVLKALTHSTELPPHFLQMRQEFPELADYTIKYALGDVWGRKVLAPKTRQLVSLAGFAAEGALPQFKVHASYALNLGVTPHELMEVIYITTVTSGFPRALNAAQALKEVFTEKGINLPLAKSSRTTASDTMNTSTEAQDKYVGMWVTQDGHIRHELLPGGRYDEARGNRKSAYRGRYTLTGDHIDYVDDTGFTADGEFRDGVLYHAGMILYREKKD